MFETIAALGDALTLRGHAPHGLTILGIALLVGGVVLAVHAKPEPSQTRPVA